MNVDVQKALKPLRKLHKLLEDFPAHPSPDEVHDLRTGTRRLEALVHTFSGASERDARHLLKLMKPVRKTAGKVRDMDVFIAKLPEVPGETAAERLVGLTEHVAGLRGKQVKRLHKIIGDHGKETRRALKQYMRRLESRCEEISSAAPQILAAELDHWPRLHAENLHEFRIRAKELRYMLQIAPEVDEQRMEMLGEVKDAAGEWHDWFELHNLAKEFLTTGSDRQVLQQIAMIVREKLRAGLSAANRLRKLAIDVPRAA